jgi:hypothetical protein
MVTIVAFGCHRRQTVSRESWPPISILSLSRFSLETVFFTLQREEVVEEEEAFPDSWAFSPGVRARPTVEAIQDLAARSSFSTSAQLYWT